MIFEDARLMFEQLKSLFANDHKNQVAVMLIDQEMKGLKGIELIRETRQFLKSFDTPDENMP